MGKALMTAARWFAPLGAWLGPRQRAAAGGKPLLGCGEHAQTRFSDGSPAPRGMQGGVMPNEAIFSASPVPMAAGTATEPFEAMACPSREAARRPLRVLRIQDGRANPRHAGRLVISGRMADVCAELERLAAAHPGLLH